MAVEELARLIAEEQDRILRLSPGDHRCALIELARAMDAFWVRTLSKQDDLGEPDDLYPFAWNKALSLFMDDACEAEGAPLIASSRESQEWADSVLQLCGRIAFCEHLLELTRAGLSRAPRRAQMNTSSNPSWNRLEWSQSSGAIFSGFVSLSQTPKRGFDRYSTVPVR